METMHNGTVNFRVDGRVATITLNRPESLNSMTNGLMDDVRQAIERVDSDDGLRVAVITGTGRGFCSGADLSAVNTDDDATDDIAPDGDVTAGMDDHFNPTMRAIKNCSVPTVARINGVAAGGGLGLALACDIGIAARSAFFVATFGPRLGIVPDLGTTWSLPLRAGRARAMGMALLGDRISADQAVEWGLIYRAVDDKELDAEVDRVCSVLERTSPRATTRIRSAIESAADRSFSEQLDVERDHQAVLIPLNMGEGAAAFLEKREPDFSH